MRQLLALFAHLNPAIFDALIPRYSPSRVLTWDAVALNPQPLPPEPDPFVIAAVRMTHEHVRLALEAEIRGEGGSRIIAELVDDWCGTPWPRKWPFPWPGPRPDGPHPDPWQLATARIAGAVTLAGLAARLGEGDLRETMGRGAEQLTEVALQG